ncbi:IS3 family transposase [Streptomyces sp. NBC_01363]|uniref:IS3 family transposase n=1 Tax=Streptomyces sp. NBC_01363 TaxID=2903840 RepID=UPI00224FB41E|nr:IS3 family transposase [Streptomyces sp. NBC_01363]MCX4734292.1 IS3 family transposase [Streptomyces sp. NBC_01363]
MSKICRFIHAEKSNYAVTLLCKVMRTARSTYYAWVAGRQAREARRRADEALAHEIAVIHLASRRNYGVPRVTAELRRQGRLVNRKRVERVMREHGIAGHSRRTGRRGLTKADTRAAPSPDLIGRDFTATRPGTKIVGDITYIPTAEGWLYLAAWLDLATREVIGYSMADHHRAELVVDALDMAAALGRLEPGCVIHSDRGSEYTSGQLRMKIGVRSRRRCSALWPGGISLPTSWAYATGRRPSRTVSWKIRRDCRHSPATGSVNRFARCRNQRLLTEETRNRFVKRQPCQSFDEEKLSLGVDL